MISLAKYKGLCVSGYSRAAHRTGIIIKGLDLILDAGLDVQKAFANIFISHQHLDHVIYIPQYILNIVDNNSTNIISTRNVLSKIKPYLTSALYMSINIPNDIDENDFYTKARTKFISMDDNIQYSFMNGSEKWNVELFSCCHSVESVGFGFSVEKNKIKEEYKNLPGKEIKKLKDSGTDITHKINENIFLFLGDTDKNIILNNKIYEYPTIIIECTYIYDDEECLAEKNKHIHWNDIKNVICDKKHIQFILIHFSMKYTIEEIKDFFDKLNLPNVNYLI